MHFALNEEHICGNVTATRIGFTRMWPLSLSQFRCLIHNRRNCPANANYNALIGSAIQLIHDRFNTSPEQQLHVVPPKIAITYLFSNT